MNRSLIWVLGLGLVVLCGGFVMGRRGNAAAAKDEDAPLFASQSQGAGRLLQLQAHEPLRAVRWLPPLAGGWAICQVGTQSDRQLIGLFQDGQLARTFPLPRPDGMTDGYYRQAELADAVMVGDTLVFLVRAESGRREAPLVMALTREGQLKWTHRTPADHVAAADGAVWAWGPEGAQRLPLEPANAGRPGVPPLLAWPYEVSSPAAFLPTPSGFLVSHGKGLSAWRSEAGWAHTPTPAASPLGFREPKGALARSGATIYWQPEPGTLLRISADAQVLGPEPLPAASAKGKDLALLRLLGSDEGGRLWFGLASPTLPMTAQPATAASTPALEAPAKEAQPNSAATPGPGLSAEERAAFESVLKAPMDRVYSWKPGDGALKMIEWSNAWPRLGAPPTVPSPSGDGGLKPEAQGILFGSDQTAWWLSLKALP